VDWVFYSVAGNEPVTSFYETVTAWLLERHQARRVRAEDAAKASEAEASLAPLKKGASLCAIEH